MSRFFGIVVYLFFKDHNTPHFKVKYNEYEANILIENGNSKIERFNISKNGSNWLIG
ncbi:MAG: DUF4160 domain-containing protein [Lewinellaceae bacterium]|nr:DUF4160 domain-containing protein [Lewinellaceae bacterium]